MACSRVNVASRVDVVPTVDPSPAEIDAVKPGREAVRRRGQLGCFWGAARRRDALLSVTCETTTETLGTSRAVEMAVKKFVLKVFSALLLARVLSAVCPGNGATAMDA